jgi:ubiquinone/menaquinone biosynthesis C-methylase UbiE
MDESHYLHGTAPVEQDRLARLNDLLNDRALAELGLNPGDRVLDVGSGLGQLARAMARRVGPGGRVLGIERSPDQIAGARRLATAAGEADLIEFREGDAQRLPLRDDEWGTFDVAHARFVVEHVTDPVNVVRQMVRAVRPGGRVVLQDDGHDTFRLSPEPPGFAPLWRSYIRTYDRVGNDPLIGHRLVSLLHQAGAAPTRNNWMFFGSCSGHPDLGAYVENIVRILEGVRQPILDVGELDAAAFDASLAALREWGTRPDCGMWYGISWAEGRRPDSGDAGCAS